LRTWERRYGWTPSGRTTGGHRRYTGADVAQLRRVQRLITSGMPAAAASAAVRSSGQPAPPAHSAAAPHSRDRLAHRFIVAVEAMDEAGAERAAQALLRSHGAQAAWTNVFTPYLQEVGHRWALTGDGVEREHLAVAVLQAALTRHTGLHRRGRTRESTVVLATGELELHTLPLHAAAAALGERGVGSCVIGNLPVASLRRTIADVAPAIVMVWAQHRDGADSFLLNECASAATIVCAAGPGWSRDDIPEGVTVLSTLSTCVELMTSWTS
jgi:MerR family transcriptional regulator, light-induced transcriptional regulator